VRIISPSTRRFTPPSPQILLELLPTLAFGVLILAVWEGVVRFFNIPRIIVPAPFQIVGSLIAGVFVHPFAVNGYLYHGIFTLAEALGGFLIGSLIGFLFAVLVSQFRTAEELLLPYIVALQSMPRIALAPLILVWVGLGPTSKLIIVFLVTFFPVFVNSLAGFRDVDPERISLLRAYGANRWQVLRLSQLPSAMPMVFAGLEIAIVYSLIGAIVGELLGSTVGLGQLLLQMVAIIDTAGMFSVFIVLGIFGMSLSQVLRLIRGRMLFWAASERVSRRR
jgi:NitT/TauT family transport system permease protein